MKKETVGKIATDLQQKQAETRDPIELQREILKEYEGNIVECIERGKKETSNDFFVVVEVKKERLLKNVVRNMFFWRHSCPTPTYDQTVYHYHAKEEALEFLWVLPAKDIYFMFLDNRLQIDPKEWGLLEFVLKDSRGELLAKAKELNGEKKDSILLEGV